MPKHYFISIPYHGSLTIEVDANSDEEALDKAVKIAGDAPASAFDDPEVDYDDAEIEESKEITAQAPKGASE